MADEAVWAAGAVLAPMLAKRLTGNGAPSAAVPRFTRGASCLTETAPTKGDGAGAGRCRAHGGRALSVAIVTDGACSLPAEMARERGVTVVPMWVTIGGRQYRDTEVSIEDLIGETVDGVSTSGPAPGELARAVEMADDGDGALVLTVSRKMSAVYDAARLASQLLVGRSVAVLDTGTAAGAQGLVVLAAAKAARAGQPLSAVLAAAERAAAIG